MLAVCTMLFAAPSAFGQRTATDIESARQLYNQGIELRDRGDLRGALEKLKAAHALGNTPITGVELCKLHASLAQPVEAREVCLGVGRIPPLAGETAHSQEARNEAARVAEDMRPKISILRLHIVGVPQGRDPVVVVDGATVPLAALGEPRAVNPGRHELNAHVGRGVETRAQIDLGPGETKDITMQVAPPPPDDDGTPPPGHDTRPRERSNTLATVGWVIGGVGLGIGSVAGIVALGDKSDLDKKCTDNICGTADHSALDTARKWGNVSTTFFIIGGVGIALGLIATIAAPRSSSAQTVPPKAVAFVPPKPKAITITPDFGPGGVGIHGAF